MEPMEQWNSRNLGTVEPWNHGTEGMMEQREPWNDMEQWNGGNHGTIEQREPWNGGNHGTLVYMESFKPGNDEES